MTELDDAEVLAELDTQFEPEPDQEELDRRAVAAEEALDDDSDVDDSAAKSRRHARVLAVQRRLLGYLRDAGDDWQPWPEVVEGVDVNGRHLAEISPINGRIRQAALALSRDGLVEIRYGRVSVFDAVRLLPAGCTD